MPKVIAFRKGTHEAARDRLIPDQGDDAPPRTALEAATVAAQQLRTTYEHALVLLFAGHDHGEAGLARLAWIAMESRIVALRASEPKPNESDPRRWRRGHAGTSS